MLVSGVRSWSERLGLLALLSLVVGPAYGLDITMCGQLVPAGETGVLQADLSDCSVNVVVTVEDGGSVSLNGHSITSSVSEVNGILCYGGCVVKGPGTISVDYAITHNGQRRRQSLTVEDVNLENNGGAAIISTRGFVLATNVTVTGNALENSPNTPVILALGGIVGTNLTVTNNGGWGIVTYRRLTLVDSVLTGNNGGGTGVDILALHRPRFINSTCGKSAGRGTDYAPWGICTGDP